EREPDRELRVARAENGQRSDRRDVVLQSGQATVEVAVAAEDCTEDHDDHDREDEREERALRVAPEGQLLISQLVRDQPWRGWAPHPALLVSAPSASPARAGDGSVSCR